MPKYVLDTNIFIESYLRNYPIDIFPSYWKLLKELADDDVIISIDKVQDELNHYEDEISVWVEENIPDSFFKTTNTNEVTSEYGKVVSWAQSRNDHFREAAINEFLEFDKADAWLVAYCMLKENTLVTLEVSDPRSKKKIHIPDVCIAHDVKHCNLVEMFRALGIKL